MMHARIVGRVQNFNLPIICLLEMVPLTFLNSLRWKKCLFLQFMHLSNYGKFVVVKQNTLVIPAIFLVKMQYFMQTPSQLLGKIEDEYDKLNLIIYNRFLILSNLVCSYLILNLISSYLDRKSVV